MAMASRRALHLLTSSRGISSTPHLASLGWFDKIKTTVTDKIKTTITGHDESLSSFTLLKYADAMGRMRKDSFAATFKNSHEAAAAAAAHERHSAVLRYLGAIDPTGEKLKTSDKISASEHCKCSVADVENALAKYTWAREAHKVALKFKEEGKPIPRSQSEIQKHMDKTPLDVFRSNLAKSDQISRNALCPCGSRKRYKRCCGAA
ncbi:uncharacterized protein [Lolium perenne]|uniref:uncharacterized protein n=1 Tax=Lolium perenne TaxID=4522 RepID=UPI0021F67360|nr:uncharacterized protein LOC127346225 [Lolium perenne]